MFRQAGNNKAFASLSFCGECFAQVSATLLVFTPEWFLHGAACRLGALGEVDGVLSVLGVDRVVPIVVRVRVSW